MKRLAMLSALLLFSCSSTDTDSKKLLTNDTGSETTEAPSSTAPPISISRYTKSVQEFLTALPREGLVDGEVSEVEYGLFRDFIAANAPSQLDYFPNAQSIEIYSMFSCNTMSDYSSRDEFETSTENIVNISIRSGVQPDDPVEDIMTVIEASIYLSCFEDADPVLNLV